MLDALNTLELMLPIFHLVRKYNLWFLLLLNICFLSVKEEQRNQGENLATIPGVKKFVIANIKKDLVKGQEIFFNYKLDFICECQVWKIQ